MKYIEDSRSLLERNRDAREYSYNARRENTAKWYRITGKALAVAGILFALSLLVGWWEAPLYRMLPPFG